MSGRLPTLGTVELIEDRQARFVQGQQQPAVPGVNGVSHELE